MDWPLLYYFFTSVTFVTVIAEIGHVQTIDAQQDERIRLECIVTSKSDADEAMWMRIRPPHNPDILTYRDTVVYESDRIELEQRRLSSSIHSNGTVVDTYFLTLTILRPKIEDEGRYICSRDRQVFSEYDLYIIVPPQFVDENNFIKQRTVIEGSVLQLSCSAYGRPKPAITWVYRTNDGKHIQLGNGSSCRDAVCELRLENYSRHDPSIIECVADNEKSARISKAFNIDVMYPPKLTTNFRMFTGSRSIDVQLECSAIANPPASIIWLDEYKQEINNSHPYNIQTMTQQSALSFSIYSEDHPHKRFYCYSNNSAGADESLINISNFIQYNSIFVHETSTTTKTTLSTQTTHSMLTTKKSKTVRPSRARSPSTPIITTETITVASIITKSSSNSCPFSFSFNLNSVLFCIVLHFICF